MAVGPGAGGVPWKAMKNTPRFHWKGAREEIWSRDQFARVMMVGVFKATPAVIKGLQGNARDSAFDVTNFREADMEEVKKKVKDAGETRPYNLFRVVDLSKGGERVVTVHMYDANMEDEAVRGFLAGYCTVKARLGDIMGPYGFWTGHPVLHRPAVILQPVPEDGAQSSGV
ncbi:hypothetical protein DPEC_G00325250 [Dallia pectoralis]|uniref:Uncharacterized protein n=1 Tax=Dallia pectoralis TaxID=75939 RepID=A0ACC2FB88_DALPE|nr:hypothetical protein DPEC_G00325250 [Dallia pectoralis]